MMKAVEAGKDRSANGMRQELMRVPNDPYQAGKCISYAARDNDDFRSSDSDRHTQQDDELDELSASVQRIGGVDLTKHEELIGQVEFVGI
ncbi:hypothetical protein MKX03_011933 [Papaver bracteatum]|nr:hypothetical protein MKX03_011933 [Papaver bracteatum]